MSRENGSPESSVVQVGQLDKSGTNFRLLGDKGEKHRREDIIDWFECCTHELRVILPFEWISCDFFRPLTICL
jgi:hypothetical protein